MQGQTSGRCSQTVILCNHLVHPLKLGLEILTMPCDPTQEFQIPYFTKHCYKFLVINSKGQVNDIMGSRESFWGGGCILRLNCDDGSITQ